MKRIALFVVAAALCSATLVRPALADDDSAPKAEHRHGHDKDGHDKDHGDWGGRGHRFKEKLGLTDDQVKKLEEARKAHWEAIKPLREQLKDAVRKVHGELEIKASNDDVASALAGVEKARKALRDENEKFKSAAAGILTPVQRAKLLVMRERMKRRRHMMAMGRGRRGGEWGNRRGCRGGGEDGGGWEGRGRGEWRGHDGMRGGDRDGGRDGDDL